MMLLSTLDSELIVQPNLHKMQQGHAILLQSTILGFVQLLFRIEDNAFISGCTIVNDPSRRSEIVWLSKCEGM